jgi:alkyl hydroperoxide reductase subunit AhpF
MTVAGYIQAAFGGAALGGPRDRPRGSRVAGNVDRVRSEAARRRRTAAKLRSLTNVSALTSAQTTEVFGDRTKVVGLDYEDRMIGAPRRLDLDGNFVQIGLVPSTEWLKGAARSRSTRVG